MNNFFKDTLLGTLALLPVAVIISIYAWFISKTQIIIAPLKPYLPETISSSPSALTFIFILLTVGSLFIVGLMLRMKLFNFFYKLIESKVLIPFAPGYKFILESVKSFLPSNDKKPFKHAVLAQPYSDDSYVLGFVTDECKSGVVGLTGDELITIYVGTAPIPTSGYTLLVKASRVTILQGVTVDEVIRTVISCGVGTSLLVEKHNNLIKEAQEKIDQSC